MFRQNRNSSIITTSLTDIQWQCKGRGGAGAPQHSDERGRAPPIITSCDDTIVSCD